MLRTVALTAYLSLSIPTLIYAQDQRVRLSFEDLATLLMAQAPADVIRRDLGPYCFDPLSADGEAVIIAGARRRDPTARVPTVIFEHVRQHPCPPRPERHREAEERASERPKPEETTRTTPLSPASRSLARTPSSDPRMVGDDGRCLIAGPTEDLRRDLRIPRMVRLMYVFVQTPGPAESSESERLAAGMDKEEFLKCFESFRNAARSRNMRLIITATDEGHRGWYQPEIRYRGRYLRVVEYKSPDGLQVFPGAEVPLQ
jgi:hypothetical protein